MKSRIFLLFGSAILIILLVGLATIAAAQAIIDHALPGDSFFPVRLSTEALNISLARDDATRIQQIVNRVPHRLNDLSARIGTPHEILALGYFDDALNRALVAIADLPTDQRADYLRAIADWVAGAKQILASSSLSNDEGVLTKFNDKAEKIRLASDDPNITGDDLRALAELTLDLPIQIASASPFNNSVNPRAIPLPSGFKHSFPLTGAHATTTCEKCHANGSYAGTPRDCASCHPDAHQNLYGQQC